MKRLELRDMAAVAMFAALTAAGAWISIPVGAVPIVLANLVALLAGALLGKWKGALSQIVYVLMGLVGLPVFAGFTSGPGIVAGKTGGYLLGYIAGAFVTGLLVQHLPRRPQPLRLSISFFFGASVIYLLGVPWLSYTTGLDIGATLAVGLYPFLAGDAIKVVAGILICLNLIQVPHIRRSPAAKDTTDKVELE